VLRWQLSHSKETEDDWVAKAAAKRGLGCPSFLSERPKLKHHLIFYWNAFWTLSTCRPIGMGEGPIPWTSVAQYVETYDLPDLDSMWSIIQNMDSVYIKERQKEANKHGERG